METMISMKKLPVGFRLNRSEEELVNHHLNRKLLGHEEQYCLIPEFDIYKLAPWDLITMFNELSDLASDGGDCFFYHRPTNPNCKSNNRKTPQGSWKSTGKGRKPQATDRIRWSKRYLVHQMVHQIGRRQKQTVKTGWAMHEYMIISNPSIVLCYIHKIKPKKGKEKVDSFSSDAGSNGSSGATSFLETQVQSQETIQEASADTTMESQNPTPSSSINVAGYSTFSPHQKTKAVADETPSLGEDAYTDFIQSADHEDPQYPHIISREQLPCSENTSMDRCDLDYGSCSGPRDVTLEEGGNMFKFPPNPIVQSSNDVKLGSVSPPQQPQAMHTEEISSLIGNTSFNGSGSGMMYPHLNTHGRGAHAPLDSMNDGPGETNLKEPTQYTFNSQTLIPPKNPDLLSPEECQMLQELLSGDWPSSAKTEGIRLSDSSEEGSPNTPYFGQSRESQQANLETTRDFAPESPAATECTKLDGLLDSFLPSPPPPEMVVGESWRYQDSTSPGGYSTEYRRVPYSSGVTYKTTMLMGC